MRGRGSGDHGAVLNRHRGPGHVGFHVHGTERAVLRRLDSHRVGHMRAIQGSRRQVICSAVDGLAIHEGVAIRRGHRIDVMRIHEIDIANVAVEDVRVTDERVVYVDDGNETPAATEPRKERLAKTQREPADSESETAAEEAHESRSVNSGTIESGAPAPPATKIIPAAIVIRSKAPGRIVNPRPTPRANPVPVAVAVRGPVRRNFIGIPHVAVFWNVTPSAVVVEIAVPIHIARNIFP